MITKHSRFTLFTLIAILLAGVCHSFSSSAALNLIQSGEQVIIYTGPNFTGRSQVLNESWPGGGYLDRRVRSVRVYHDDGGTPTPEGYPVIYSQPNLQGPARAIERDWPGSPDWLGSPHRIRSIRVPQGWYLVLYDKKRYRGQTCNLSSDWTPQPGDYWYGNIRSIKVYKGTPPKQPR